MKKILYIIFLIATFGYSQSDIKSRSIETTVTAAQMNAIPVSKLTNGTRVYRSDTKTIWIYDVNVWVDSGVGANGVSGGVADGNDFATGGSLVGETLNLIVPNQTFNGIDLSAFALDSDLGDYVLSSNLGVEIPSLFPNLDTDDTDDFDGTWGSLTGIPADIADGDDDTQLTQTQISALGFITNPDDADANPTNELQTASEVPADNVNGNTDLQAIVDDLNIRINALAAGGSDGVVTNIELTGNTLVVDGTGGGEDVDVDLSDLDESAGVTANATNIADNTTDINDNLTAINALQAEQLTQNTDIANNASEIASDLDGDPNNEIQTISFNPATSELSISASNTITIPTGGTSTDDQNATEVDLVSVINGDTNVEDALQSLNTRINANDYIVAESPINAQFSFGTNAQLDAVASYSNPDVIEIPTDGNTLAIPANNITYNNSVSGITATNAQDAFDELIGLGLTDNQQLDDLNTSFNTGTNELTIALEDGGTATADLSALATGSNHQATLSPQDAVFAFGTTAELDAVGSYAESNVVEIPLDATGNLVVNADNVLVADIGNNFVGSNVEDVLAELYTNTITQTEGAYTPIISAVTSDNYTTTISEGYSVVTGKQVTFHARITGLNGAGVGGLRITLPSTASTNNGFTICNITANNYPENYYEIKGILSGNFISISRREIDTQINNNFDSDITFSGTEIFISGTYFTN